MKDLHGRQINYMRIAVTDRCNLRCSYCETAESLELIPRAEVLDYEEIVLLAKIAVSIGIEKFRLTGGEPLLRRDLSFLIKGLLKIPGLNEVTLTTNGVLLNRFVNELWDAGLRRLNISLDTLDSVVYSQLTGRDSFSEVWSGLQAAIRKGFAPVKINVVLLKGINEDVEPFVKLTRDFPLHVRFIELMEFAPQHSKFYVSAEEAWRKLIKLGGFKEETSTVGAGPARYFRLEGAAGTVGFISPYTEHFCGTCNRLRISADGKIKPCLFSDFAVDIKKPLRSGWPEKKLRGLIIKALKAKPQGRKKTQGEMAGQGMRRIGG